MMDQNIISRKRTRSISGPNARAVALLLASGFQDYLAARVLLLQGLPLQAAGLAATAVEKHLKAVLGMRRQTYKKHLNAGLLRAVRQTDSNLFQKLDEGFLILLQRGYKLRYLDSIPSEFNLVIASNEFLAELDMTISTIRVGFHFKGIDEEISLSNVGGQYDSDPRYREHNIAVSGMDKRSFISARPQWVYEVRAKSGYPLFEILYLAKAQVTDGKFLREGMTPKNDACRSFNLAFSAVE